MTIQKIFRGETPVAAVYSEEACLTGTASALDLMSTVNMRPAATGSPLIRKRLRRISFG